jgi:transposase-like protein
MTDQLDTELLNTVLQLLTKEGASGFAEGLRLLVNEAMFQERSALLQARPYERSEARLGHANGFKPKTLATRLGAIEFRVPQVRGEVEFYPSSLEKGVRSEQALKLAMAEMYVQRVSTRKVSAIVEQLCGHSVSSTQVSQCAAKLDAELSSWRNRPLGVTPYLMLDAFYSKSAPKLASWMESNIPEGLDILALPQAHQRRLCTSNALERVNQELKRPYPRRLPLPQRTLSPAPRIRHPR